MAYKFKTHPTAGTASYNFCVSSCNLAISNSTIFNNIVNRNPLFFFHLGDRGYPDISLNNLYYYRVNYNNNMLNANHAALHQATSVKYIWSDHDWGGDNTDATATGGPACQAVYRERVPNRLLVPSDGCYFTFVVGRVRFIATDLRSYRSAPSATDNGSKTMMGATQLSWFTSTTSAATEPVIVWLCEVPWNYPTTAGQDNWGGYNTERASLISTLTTQSKLAKMYIISGDMHALAADSGTNSPGGIPTFNVSPLDVPDPGAYGTWSQGTYTANNLYGNFVVTDSGTSVTIAATGYDLSDTSRITLSKTY